MFVDKPCMDNKAALSHSVQLSPYCEANRFAASQDIPRIFRSTKVHYRIHKCPPPVHFLNQLHPVHTAHATS